MAVYVTGDTHGHYDWSKLNTEQFRKQRWMKPKDVMIIAGDFGGVWDDGKQDKYVQSFYNEKKFTTAFVDGNHENHWLLNANAPRQWSKGKIHRISEKIIHLMRGEVYIIQDKKFFVFGGANSVDKAYRTYGITWWPEELPNVKEYNNALKNLAKHNFEVDYVITHTCPTSVLYKIYDETYPYQYTDEVSEFLEKLLREYKLKFHHWYFGHHHIDKHLNNQFTAVYNNIIRIL